jgi:hypothetical protein
MSRFASGCFWLLALGLGACPAARAQAVASGPGPSEAMPLDSRALAQALRAAERADPQELVRARRDAARAAYAEALDKGRSPGWPSPDLLTALSLRLLAAELAAAGSRPERLAALQGQCVRVRHLEDAITERYQGGTARLFALTYLPVHSERLLAELALAASLKGDAGALPGAPEADPGGSNPLTRGPTARDQFAAAHATPRALAPSAADALLRATEARLEAVAGRKAFRLADYLTTALRRVEMARVLGDGPADLLPVLEGYWAVTWDVERMSEEYRAAAIGPVSMTDDLEVHDRRLEAEAWIAEARSRPGRPLPLKGGLQEPFGAFIVEDPLDTRDFARAKFEGTRLDSRQLARQRQAVLLEGYAIGAAAIRDGRSIAATPTIDMLRRLAAVELSLVPSRAERIAALERYWARARELEELTKERAPLGLMAYTIADYWEARGERLRAQAWLVEGRREKGEK